MIAHTINRESIRRQYAVDSKQYAIVNRYKLTVIGYS